jgi:hypothetical protein
MREEERTDRTGSRYVLFGRDDSSANERSNDDTSIKKRVTGETEK